MTKEKIEYNRIMGLIRKSKPSFDQQGRAEEYIIEQVAKVRKRGTKLHDLAESLFGWVYIPTMRRILVTAAIVLIGIFIFQQYALVKQVRNISRQVIVIKNDTRTESAPDLGSKLVMYKLSDRFFSSGEIRISGKELEKIIEAYDELDGKYHGLLKIIEENPDLRNYVEKKLEEQEKNKPNL
jgi:hypothetical protein